MGKRHLILITALVFLLGTLGFAGKAPAALHTVSPGDTLYKIAQWNNTTTRTLIEGNELDSTTIYPGQVLWVPVYHTVQAGDTLYSIGKHYGVHYSEIMRSNGLQTTEIQPGQKLYIPEGQAEASRSSTGSYGAPAELSRSEMDLLARLITAEAATESFKTKVAVGAVVLNRVESSKFPNSVTEVIYQVDSTGRYQFSPVMNGWINRPASRESILAARQAVNGRDPSNGALYFWESWVQNSYLNSRPVSVVLGAFTFTW